MEGAMSARELRSGERLEPGDRVWTVYLRDPGTRNPAAEEIDVVAPSRAAARRFVQKLLDENVYDGKHLRVGRIVERPVAGGWVSLW